MEKEKKKKCTCEEECTCNQETNNSELDSLKTKLAEEQAKCMRIQADMINFKKRKEEEIASFYKYANLDLIESLLPTIDNFERALTSQTKEDLSEEVKKYLSGFEMIYANLVKTLNDLGVKEIEALDADFDPNYHQAVLTEKDENKQSNAVLAVLQKGYLYKDKVIRPAMVKVNE